MNKNGMIKTVGANGRSPVLFSHRSLVVGLPRAARRGLSIIELLVVMTILTILASMAVITYTGVTSRQRVKTAKNIVHSFRMALEMYKTNANVSGNGGYPYELGVATYDDFYKTLSPYLSGDYKNYFDTTTFSYKAHILDASKLPVPTAYTIAIKARVSETSLLTATHKSLVEATLNGEVIK